MSLCHQTNYIPQGLEVPKFYLSGEGKPIDKNIKIQKPKKVNGLLLSKIEDIDIFVQPYNSCQVAIDEFKKGLNILIIGYNIIKYGNRNYMISRNRNHMTLETKLNKYDGDVDFFSEICVKEIRKIFAFQWLLGVDSAMGEKTLILEHYLDGPDFYFLTPYSYNESFSSVNRALAEECAHLDTKNLIPSKILKVWFKGDMKNVYKSALEIFQFDYCDLDGNQIIHPKISDKDFEILKNTQLDRFEKIIGNLEFRNKVSKILRDRFEVLGKELRNIV